jgi:hypothetical protein
VLVCGWFPGMADWPDGVVPVPKVWIRSVSTLVRPSPERWVAPGASAAVDLGEVAVHSDEEDIQAIEQSAQVGTPGGELDDVLNDQVIADGR